MYEQGPIQISFSERFQQHLEVGGFLEVSKGKRKKE